MKPTRSRICRAFTLIEVLAVVVILAIAALISVPVLSNAGQMQLTAAAQKLAADLEYAKSMAVSTQRVHQVQFDVSQNRYTLMDDANTPLPDPVKKGSNYVVDYASHGRLNRVKIHSLDLGGSQTVQFDYMGSPTPEAGGTVVLGSDGHTVTISIEAVTGYIKIQ